MIPNGFTRRRQAWLGALVPLAAFAAFTMVLAGCASSAAPSASSPATFHVDVGYEDLASAFEAEAFFPRNVTVDVGDRVVFTMQSHEAHTISFNAPSPVPDPMLPQPDHSILANPVIFFSSPPSRPGDPKAAVALTAAFDGSGYVNSGFLQKPGDSFTVVFSAPGTYKVLCMLHPEAMQGTVVVNPAGTPRPMTDAGYRAAAAAELGTAKDKGAALLAGTHVPAPTVNADGSHTYLVYAGVGSTADGIDYMRYIGGEKLTVKVGDSVTFDMQKNSMDAPHTVTFLQGTDDPDLVLPQPQAGGPPKLLLNPKVQMPAPLPQGPFDGKGYFNSGLMVVGKPTPQVFTVTFVRPGTYQYQCIFHDDAGMKGTIVVEQ